MYKVRMYVRMYMSKQIVKRWKSLGGDCVIWQSYINICLLCVSILEGVLQIFHPVQLLCSTEKLCNIKFDSRNQKSTKSNGGCQKKLLVGGVKFQSTKLLSTKIKRFFLTEPKTKIQNLLIISKMFSTWQCLCSWFRSCYHPARKCCSNSKTEKKPGQTVPSSSAFVENHSCFLQRNTIIYICAILFIFGSISLL